PLTPRLGVCHAGEMEPYDARRQEILDDIATTFCVRLVTFPPIPHDQFPHPAVSTHALDPIDNDPDAPSLWERIRGDVGRWVLAQGWQLSRRFVDGRAFGIPRDIRYEYLAPRIDVSPPSVVYHATRISARDSILRDGLLPSGTGASVPKRPDCEGNL